MPGISRGCGLRLQTSRQRAQRAFYQPSSPILRAVSSGSPWRPGAPWREPLLAAYVSSFESRLFSSSSHLLTGGLGVWCLCGNPCIFDLSLCQMCGGRGFRPLRGLSLGLAVISFTVQKLPDFMESWDISWAVGAVGCRCRESLPEFTP